MIAQANAAEEMASQRASPVRRYRTKAQAPAVAVARPSVSAITTRLDWSSCPVAATIKPATSGTKYQCWLVALVLPALPISAASRRVKAGTAAPAVMLTICPAGGMIPPTKDIRGSSSGDPGGQKNGGGGGRRMRACRRGAGAQ